MYNLGLLPEGSTGPRANGAYDDETTSIELTAFEARESAGAQMQVAPQGI